MQPAFSTDKLTKKIVLQCIINYAAKARACCNMQKLVWRVLRWKAQNKLPDGFLCKDFCGVRPD